MQSSPIATPIPLWYTGPSLIEGPLPSIFYFALSAEDTLLQTPFNSPLSCLKDKKVRFFSATLPCHGPGSNAKRAITDWACHFAKGEDILLPFISLLVESIQILLSAGYLLKNSIGVCGLSRGAMIASHVAAKVPEINTLLLFAPLIDLLGCTEFTLHPSKIDLTHLSLFSLPPLLYQKKSAPILEGMTHEYIQTYATSGSAL